MPLTPKEKLELAELLQEKDRRTSKRTLKLFTEHAWEVIEPGRVFVPNWHIDAICDHLEALFRGEIRNLLINMPPRHMKSLLVSVLFPAWVWLHRPEMRFLFASYAQTLSVRDSVKCRRLIDSRQYRELRPPFKLQADQNTKTRFDNDATGYRIATSVGGSGTGEGGDIIACDDPHNAIEKESEVIREGVLEWWDETMSTRGNDPKTVSKIIVMQRLHERDLSGHVLEKGGWEHLKLPAEFHGQRKITSIGWQDPRTKEGELLWPERFGAPELATLKKDLGEQASAGQLDQEPAPAGGNIIKRHWLKFYLEPPKRFHELIQSWDLGQKDGQKNDFTVGGCWGRVSADCYLLDMVSAQAKLPAQLAMIRAFTNRHPLALLKIVEDKANGPAVISMLEKEIPGIVPYSPDRDKVARLSACSPMFEAGNIWLPHPSIAPWVPAYVEQLVKFPAARNDDMVDMTSQALLRFLQHRSRIHDVTKD